MDKKIYQEEMCGSRCSILIYIYLFNYKNFFWNLHFDRADNTFACVWERGSFQDPGIQFSLGSNDGNFSIIGNEHYVQTWTYMIKTLGIHAQEWTWMPKHQHYRSKSVINDQNWAFMSNFWTFFP